MFCFVNGEVLTLLRRKWQQQRLMRGGKQPHELHTYYTQGTLLEPVHAVSPAAGRAHPAAPDLKDNDFNNDCTARLMAETHAAALTTAAAPPHNDVLKALPGAVS